MSYLSRWLRSPCRTSSRRRSGMAVLAAVDPRVLAPLGERRSATSGSTSTGRSSTSFAAHAHPRDDARLAGRRRRRSTAHATATTLEGGEQTIARGPAASQIAIKQLGTNGGGFYNSNSAVPFENPNGFTNFLEMLSILLIPAAQVSCSGGWSRTPAGWPIFAAMFAMFADRRRDRASLRAARLAGAAGLRRQHHAGDGQSGGNMADKEVRYGIANTALWATATTDASNGSVNGGHDALTADRRRRADREHVRRRGDLRRRRLRPLRDVLLRPDRRLRGRA